QESGLAGTRARNQADHLHSGTTETVAQAGREKIVFLENLPSDFHHAGLVHVMISIPVISSSSPWTTGSASEPESLQIKAGKARVGLSARHLGQKITTSTGSINSRDCASAVSCAATL